MTASLVLTFFVHTRRSVNCCVCGSGVRSVNENYLFILSMVIVNLVCLCVCVCVCVIIVVLKLLTNCL